MLEISEKFQRNDWNIESRVKTNRKDEQLNWTKIEENKNAFLLLCKFTCLLWEKGKKLKVKWSREWKTVNWVNLNFFFLSVIKVKENVAWNEPNWWKTIFYLK